MFHRAVGCNGALLCGITVKGIQGTAFLWKPVYDGRDNRIPHQGDIVLFFLCHVGILLRFSISIGRNGKEVVSGYVVFKKRIFGVQ